MLKKIVGIFFRKIPWRLRRKVIRLSQSKFTASVAAFVFNENGEILLLDHVLRPDEGWAIPGGFMNSHEQPAEAVKREIYEETGLNLKELKMIRVRTIGQHLEILFRAEAVGTAKVKSLEINAVGWFKTDELPEKMSRVQKSLIEEVRRGAKSELHPVEPALPV